MAVIKTDEKKQHFDDIYVAETPVPFKEQIIDALDYVSDDFNRAAFDRLILPWAAEMAGRSPLNLVDLCCCFGNTTMAVANGMSVDEIKQNWASEEASQRVETGHRFPAKTTGIDISRKALAYARSAGIFERTIQADLNELDSQVWDDLETTFAAADIVIATAALVYLEIEAIRRIVRSFSSGSREGYLMVNFLNPFALEKADETKRALLEELEFVGSNATRHRRLSPLEQENYPGEEWALLEIWVLRRPGS